MIDIEKGIAIPQPHRGCYKYPFDKMDVGDSFAVPPDDEHNVRSAASWYGKRNSQVFSVRRLGDGTRCWRVE